MSTKGTKKGEGFAPRNYTQTPNTLFDLLPVMSNAELRVTMALVRETYGWHRQRTDMLSVPELATKAGLSESSAKTGIQEAVRRGTLKRFKARDDKNRPTFKYGMVITDQVTREEFERPKKQSENLDQDNVGRELSGQNLTGSEIDRVNGPSGQLLTPSPEELSGQNLPVPYKEERNILLGKKGGEHQAAKKDIETTLKRDDGFQPEEQDDFTLVEGEQQPHIPIFGSADALAETNMEGNAEFAEDAPATAVAAWNPADVDAELQRLTSRRWLNSWTARGASSISVPLIDEVDGSGVDRHLIAKMVSPEYLAEIVAKVRAELVNLKHREAVGETVKIFTFQHLLIQELQRVVDRVEATRTLVHQASLSKQDEAQEMAPLVAPRGGATRAWQVGDVVVFQRCRYHVERITDTYLDLYDDENGSVKVVRNTREFDALKFVQPAEASA